MKYVFNIGIYIFGALYCCCLIAVAQTPPKLALAGVTVAPTLAGKSVAPPPTSAAAPSANADVLGVWTGNVGPSAWTVTIKEAPGGSLRALFENHEGNYSCWSDSAVKQGNHLSMTFFNNKAKSPNRNAVEGDVNAALGVLQVAWSWHGVHGRRVVRNATLHRREAASKPVTPPTPVSLENVAHLIEIQLFDRFKGEQVFNLLGEAELAEKLAPVRPPYDLSQPATAAKFKQAGVNYLLFTSLEEFTDQTIEKRRTKDLHYQTGVYYRAGSYNLRYGRRGFSAAGNSSGGGVATQGGIDPEVWLQQTLRLTVRCQLFDCQTGELKISSSTTFPFLRNYTAVAQGENGLSTSDLCAAAALKISEWETGLVDEGIFPIRVLAIKEKDLTISRGSEAGLKIGQYFDVCTKGAALIDPDTGSNLGFDVKNVGYVIIDRLEPKFSHAKVLEDRGIALGATLVRANH